MNILKVYGFFGVLRLLLDKLNTIIFFNRARIIRRPYYIRGKRYIEFGKNLTTGVAIRLDAFPKHASDNCIIFGNNIEVNDYVHIAAIEKVIIGNNVLIASKVFISDHNHGNYSSTKSHDSPYSIPKERKWQSAPVIIEENVWIGENVSILPGVTIGKGSIIGAMSLVNKNIPQFAIAVGVPAKVIKKYNFETQKWENL